MQYLLDEICQFSFVLKLPQHKNIVMFKYDICHFVYVHIVCKGVITTHASTQLPPFASPPLYSVPPTFKRFQIVPPTLTQIPPVLIQSTNLSWFKKTSKGRIYQLNCHFLSKINLNLLNPFTNRLPYFMGYFQLHFQLTGKNNFSSNA